MNTPQVPPPAEAESTARPPQAQTEAVTEAFTAWWTPQLRRRALLGAAACVLLPWLATVVAASFIQAGLHPDAQRTLLRIEYMAIGAGLFGLSMLLTWLVGCWVTAVMKGPQHQGDAFPAERDTPDAR